MILARKKLKNYKKHLSAFDKKRLRKSKKLPWKYIIWLILFAIEVIVVGYLALKSTSNILVEIRLTVSDVSFDFLRKEGHPLFNDMWVKKARFVHFKKFVIPFTNAFSSLKGWGSQPLEADQAFAEEKMPPGWTPAGTNGELSVIPMDNFSSIIFNDILFSELNLVKNGAVRLSLVKNDAPEVNIFIDNASTSGKIDIKKEQLIECQACRLQLRRHTGHFSRCSSSFP